MAHIIVLGAGLGGVAAAFEMKDLLTPEDSLIVVSNLPVYQFAPSNPWLAVGWRKREDIEVPLAPVYEKRGIHFIPTGCKKVLPEKNCLELDDGSILNYDYLIIATGPSLSFDGIEGFGPEAGYAQSICRLDHAEKAWAKWQQFVSDPGPIVVGAAQGVSCFGPAYEFALIMDADLRERKIRDRVPMTFVTPEPYIGHMGLGGVGDTKGLLESKFRERSIRWICNARIKKIEPDNLVVSEVDENGNEKKVHELEFQYSMIMPPFLGVSALRDIDGLVNQKGFVLVDPYQRNPKFKNIFAVGVCVAIPPVESTPVPVGVPKTGYMNDSMASAAAHNIRELIAGKEPSHLPSLTAVCLADFGDRGVAFVAMPQIPPRNVNWSSEGKWVHLAKIAFEKYYLRKVKKGISEPFYEKYVFKFLGIQKLKS